MAATGSPRGTKLWDYLALRMRRECSHTFWQCIPGLYMRYTVHMRSIQVTRNMMLLQDLPRHTEQMHLPTLSSSASPLQPRILRPHLLSKRTHHPLPEP